MFQLDQRNNKKIMNMILINGSVILASILLKKGFDFAYLKINHHEPPRRIRHSSRSVLHVIGWSMLTGAAAGIARLIARDFAEHNVEGDPGEAVDPY